MEPEPLTAPQQEMVRVWAAHLAAEFDARSAQAAVATTVAHPHVTMCRS